MTTETSQNNAKPQKKPQAAPMAIGSPNTLAPKLPGVKFIYQLETNSPKAKDDEITLKHNESDFTQTVLVADLKEIHPGWVMLRFMEIPEYGTFDLIQDPKDGDEPFFIFCDVPFEELTEVEKETEIGPPYEGPERPENGSSDVS